jgi:hypothetical protein
MIKVGTLVGIMVLPGEDWKNVKIPDGAEKSSDSSSTPTQSNNHNGSNETSFDSSRSKS